MVTTVDTLREGRNLTTIQTLAEALIGNVERVIIGKRDVVTLAVVALLCEGHVLLEDVPGVGKTMLARALAVSLGGVFKRIQFTPDLLPNDATGVSVFNQKTGEFEFRPGPAFANVLLADEINRATPRTQSSLLECMGERQISVDGTTYPLPRPFFVLATQNPVEYEGTFPLPEAQLDRFLLRLRIGYPSVEDERQIIAGQRHGHPIDRLEAVVATSALIDQQLAVADVFVEDSVREYILAIVRATRENAELTLGASPRGTLALYRTAQAYAAIKGRDFVLPDDVKLLAPFALSHRLIVKPESQLRGYTASEVIGRLLQTIPVPVASSERSR